MLYGFQWVLSKTSVSGYQGWLLSFTIWGPQEPGSFLLTLWDSVATRLLLYVYWLQYPSQLLLGCCCSLLAAIPKVPLSGRNRIAKYPSMHRDLPVGTFRIHLEMTAPEAQDKVLIDLDFCVGLTKLLLGGAYRLWRSLTIPPRQGWDLRCERHLSTPLAGTLPLLSFCASSLLGPLLHPPDSIVWQLLNTVSNLLLPCTNFLVPHTIAIITL